jgi:hypothetical protein
MTARKYPFYPSWDGKATSPITKKFYDLCKRRWAFTNLGMYANRQMRGSKNLSVHATGFAVDMGYPATRAGRAAAKEAWTWLVDNSEALLLAELHDYSFRNPAQPKIRQNLLGSRVQMLSWPRARRRQTVHQKTMPAHQGAYGSTQKSLTNGKPPKHLKRHGEPCQSQLRTPDSFERGQG